MMRGPSILLALLALSGLMAEDPVAVEPVEAAEADDQNTESPRINGATISERLAAYQRAVAALPLTITKEARGVVPLLAARVLAGQEPQPLIQQWQDIATSVLTSARGRLKTNPKDSHARNPFEKHALVHAYLACRGKVSLPPALATTIRDYTALYQHRAWIGYGALNYRLMNDGAGYLAAELWPELTDADGLDAAGIRAATKGRLFGYFNDIVRNNTDEYGAPTYLGIDLSAMKMLADFAQDPEMRKRAGRTLDAMLLQVACAWNHGYYVTTASRAKYFGTSMTGPDAPDTTAAIAWLYWGGLRPVDARHMNPPGSWWFTVPGTYAPPAVFAAIANDRDQPVTHRASARQDIRLTIHHQPGWSLASEWNDLSGPTHGHTKESRRTMLKWVSDRPLSTFIPMQDNARRPYLLSEKVANAFGYGENPFTQVLQHEGTLIGVTNVPADYPYFASYAPFTTAGAIVLRREREGWVLCHGGSVVFAFRYLSPAAWTKPRLKDHCDVLRCEARTTGWILQAASPAEFPGTTPEETLDRFGTAVIAGTTIDQTRLSGDHPELRVHSRSGHDLALTWRPFKEPYATHQRIDGVPVDYNTFPLLGNPWVEQALGSPLLKIHHGTTSLTYHFDTWTTEGGL